MIFLGRFTTTLLVFCLGLALTGCNVISPDVPDPPLPTIVPAAITHTPLPPATPTPEIQVTPTATVTNQAEASAPTATLPPAVADTPASIAQEPPAPEPTPVPTTVVSPTPAVPTPLPEEALAVAQLPSLDSISLSLTPVATGFTRPLFVTHAGDGSGRLFLLEQAGRILVIKDGTVNPTPFLDIVSIVGSDANEQGLLSVAFHPDYAANGQFFVNYTNKQGDTVVARYQVSDNPDVANPGSEKILLYIPQPHANHNGGQLTFGPDGYLYIGMGDGGAANDPQNRAQNLADLLGKILRIDVNNGDPYGVPQTNPFVGNSQARPEIWSVGWRNPWRFSFDTVTGDMYAGDVGQNQFEEISFEPAGATGGQNFGWRLMEGQHCFNPRSCDPAAQNLILPIAEYDHSQGCSVTGGYVYRGQQFPALQGIYFYADYCSGIIWGLRYDEANGTWLQAELLDSGKTISSFGQDETGEVYLVDHKGALFKLGN